MPGVTSYLKIAVSTRNWLAGSVCIGGEEEEGCFGRWTWTDTIPTVSLSPPWVASSLAWGGGRRAEGGWAQCALGTHRSVAKVSKTLLGHGGEREGRGACTYHVLIVSGSHLVPHVISNARSHYLHFLGLVLCSWPLSRLCGEHCVWKPRRRLSVSPSPGPGCSPIGICGVTGVFRRMHLSLAYKLLECVSDQK